MSLINIKAVIQESFSLPFLMNLVPIDCLWSVSQRQMIASNATTQRFPRYLPEWKIL